MQITKTNYGFEWGSARVDCLFNDDKRGWVTIGLKTPKHEGNRGLQIYVTKTGKVRIHDARGEWTAPESREATK